MSVFYPKVQTKQKSPIFSTKTNASKLFSRKRQSAPPPFFDDLAFELALVVFIQVDEGAAHDTKSPPNHQIEYLFQQFEH